MEKYHTYPIDRLDRQISLNVTRGLRAFNYPESMSSSLDLKQQISKISTGGISYFKSFAEIQQEKPNEINKLMIALIKTKRQKKWTMSLAKAVDEPRYGYWTDFKKKILMVDINYYPIYAFIIPPNTGKIHPIFVQPYPYEDLVDHVVPLSMHCFLPIKINSH